MAALIRSKYPQLTAAQVYERLTVTAIDKGPKGRDPETGFGIVNPVAALDPNFKPSASAAASGSAVAAPSDDAEPPVKNTNWVYLAVGIACCSGLVLAAIIVATVLVLRSRKRRNQPTAASPGTGYGYPPPPGYPAQSPSGPPSGSPPLTAGGQPPPPPPGEPPQWIR